jgi:hypothetical protein
MRTWGWSLLAAVLPWMGPAESPSMPLRPVAPPCSVALDLRLEVPLRWGAVEWRIFAGEVEQRWTPYGVKICWQVGVDSCEGFAVQLRVLVAEVLPPAATTNAPVVGRIPFYEDGPGAEIFLSIQGGRYLVTHATLGGRKVGDWPGDIAEHLLPAVMGRALAHELGHFLLGSKRHSRTGLMAAQFRPDEVTFGGGSQFQLSDDEARVVRMQCLAGRLNARRAAASEASFAQYRRVR